MWSLYCDQETNQWEVSEFSRATQETGGFIWREDAEFEAFYRNWVGY